MKATVRRQYQRLVDGSVAFPLPTMPPEGWLRTVRKALGMSGAQMAARMGVTRARIAQAENAELSGGATIRSMQAAAEALGCRFIYAVVPSESVAQLIESQARKKASAIVRTASIHMALEGQVLPDGDMAEEVSRVSADLAHDMPPDLWTDG